MHNSFDIGALLTDLARRVEETRSLAHGNDHHRHTRRPTALDARAPGAGPATGATGRDRPQPDLLTPDDVARKLGVTVSLLGRWRANGKGPPWIAMGARKVVYSEAGLDTWLERGFRETQEKVPRSPGQKREVGISLHGGWEAVPKADRFRGHRTKRKRGVETERRSPTGGSAGRGGQDTRPVQ